MLRKSVLYLTRARAGKYLYVLMTDGPGAGIIMVVVEGVGV